MVSLGAGGSFGGYDREEDGGREKRRGYGFGDAGFPEERQGGGFGERRGGGFADTYGPDRGQAPRRRLWVSPHARTGLLLSSPAPFHGGQGRPGCLYTISKCMHAC